MSKFLKDLKKNKYTTVSIVIFILLIFLGYGVYKILIPNNGTPVYGNRLEGIDEVEVTKKQLQELDEEIVNESFVIESNSYTNGRIVNIILTIKEGVKEKDAKKITSTIVEYFTKDQLSYYDLELFITCEDESYSIIGYKNKNMEDFTF